MATQRPGRQPTRLGQPAVKSPASAGRPATGGVPKQQAAATGRAGGRAASTRSVATVGPGRQQPQKSNTMLFAGIGGGVVVLLLAAFLVMGSKSENHAPPPKKEASKAKPVDVSGLERDGISKCEEGLKLIQKNQTTMGSHSLSPAQKQSLMVDLEKGKKLIADGMGLLAQANEKSKNTYDTKQYQEALITVRKKLMELRD